MSLLSDLLKPGFISLHGIMGDPFTIDGVEYAGTFSAERVEYSMEEFSQREVVRRSIVALKSQWQSKPDSAQKPEVVIAGVTYVIAGEVAEDGVHYVFNLEKRT